MPIAHPNARISLGRVSAGDSDRPFDGNVFLIASGGRVVEPGAPLPSDWMLRFAPEIHRLALRQHTAVAAAPDGREVHAVRVDRDLVLAEVVHGVDVMPRLVGRVVELEGIRAGVDEHAIVAVTDCSGRITEVNDKFCAISGYSREELIGNTHRIVNSGTHPAPFFRAMWRTILDGRIWRGEICNRRKDGTLYWVATTILPLRDGAGVLRGFLALRTDITAVKLAEAEQRRQEQRTLEAQRRESLSLLAAGVAHDFNNILAGIVANLEELSQAFAEDSPAGILARETTAIALRAGDMTRTLLAFAGQGEHPLQAVDFGQVLEASRPFLVMAGRRRARLIIDPAPSVFVDGDAGQLRQILLNLVINAAEAVPAVAGEIKVRLAQREATEGDLQAARVVSASTRTGPHAVLEVEDNGPGLPAAVLERIGEPFVSSKGGGRGIGLAAVMGIVRRHSGWLQVASGAGAGTRFTIGIPVRAGPAPKAVAPQQGPEGRFREAIVVDDDPVARQAAARALALCGATARQAANVGEAILLLETEGRHPEVALIDVNLGDGRGSDAAATLQQRVPGLKVLFVTGFLATTDAEHLPGPVLQKPFSSVDLRRALADLARGGRKGSG